MALGSKGKYIFQEGYRDEKDRKTGMDVFNEQDERLTRQALAEDALKQRQKAADEKNKKEFEAINEVFNSYGGQVAGTAADLKGQSSKLLLGWYQQLQAGDMTDAQYETNKANLEGSMLRWNQNGVQALESFKSLSDLTTSEYQVESLDAEKKRYAKLIKVSGNTRLNADGTLSYYDIDKDGNETLMDANEYGALVQPFNPDKIRISSFQNVVDKLKPEELEWMGHWVGNEFVRNNDAAVDNEILAHGNDTYFPNDLRKQNNRYVTEQTLLSQGQSIDNLSNDERTEFDGLANQDSNESLIRIYDSKFKAYARKINKEHKAGQKDKEDKTTYKPTTYGEVLERGQDKNGFWYTSHSGVSGKSVNPVESVTGQLVEIVDGRPVIVNGKYSVNTENKVSEKNAKVKNVFFSKDLGQIVVQLGAAGEVDINKLIEREADKQGRKVDSFSEEERANIKQSETEKLIAGMKQESAYMIIDQKEFTNLSGQIEGLDNLYKVAFDQREVDIEGQVYTNKEWIEAGWTQQQINAYIK